jgi:hypothetical protein
MPVRSSPMIALGLAPAECVIESKKKDIPELKA